MNHFMLPDGDSEARIPACFGIHAMELVINKMMRLLVRPECRREGVASELS